MWHLEAVDYDSADPDVQKETADMWDALRTFTGDTVKPA